MAWEQCLAIGHATLDAQHQALLTQACQLATLCNGVDDPQQAKAFDAAFDQFKNLARAHFEDESVELARRGHAELHDLADELDDFEYMADEIVTTSNFDRLELQRFLAMWALGHVTASARRLQGSESGDAGTP